MSGVPDASGDRDQQPGSGRGRQVSLLIGLTLASFLVTFEDSAVGVALPLLRTDLGLGLDQLEWTLNAYSLGLVAVLLLAGKLVDRFGARPVLVVGIALFTAASLPAAFAQSGGILIGARAVQGIGAGFIAPASLAMIGIAFPPARRGLVIGTVAGVSAVGLGAGPLVGGIIVEYLGWSGLFLLNLPVGVGLLALSTRSQKHRRPGAATRLDVPGAAAAGSTLLLGLLAITRGTDNGWTSPQVLVLIAGALLSGITFVLVERHAADPLAPPALLRSRQLGGAATVGLLSTASMCSLFFFVSLYLQEVQDYGVVATGAVFLPMTIVIAIGSPAAGLLAARLPAATLVAVGMTLVAAAMLLLSRVDAGLGRNGIVGGLALAGLGVALTATPVTTAALVALPPDRQGLAGSLVGTARAAELAIGVAIMGAILAAGPDGDLSGRLSTGLELNAVLAAVGAVAAGVLLRQGGRAWTASSSAADRPPARQLRAPAANEDA